MTLLRESNINKVIILIQGYCPPAGLAVTFSLQLEKVTKKKPPLKDKKLKTECVPLKISKLLPLVVKQGNFLYAH